MKIDSKNYYESINKLGVNNLPSALKKGHELIERATKGGTDWKAYQMFQKPFDLQFQAVGLLLENKSHQKAEAPHPKKQTKEYPVKEKTVNKKPVTEHFIKPKVNGKDVELISPEVAFIRRYALLHEKTKTKDQILSFIRALQKAIVEKKIRKSSKHASLIEDIQRRLITVYHKMGKEIKLSFDIKNLERYLKIAGSEIVMPSVRFIKAYINMQGKDMSKEKAKSLVNRIYYAIEKKKLSENDRYFKHIKIIIKSLEDYIRQSSAKHTLNITEAQLNGLEGVLKECGCHSSLNGIEDNSIMNSTDFSELKFDTIGFMGKWKALIGDPSAGFTTMVYGKPKMGKSYFCIDWANYLSIHHGKVLYVSKEEFMSPTLALKFKDKQASNNNLDISGSLPDDLTPYQFIFLDSVTSMKLTSDDLKNLENQYPDKSFIYVFQVTKNGSARGTNEFMHNVDVVIEIPEKGKAVQFGRFNQGGEMEIFE